MVKLHFKQAKYEDMMTAYKQMLTYIKSAVTRNYSEKVINKVLDLVSASQQMEVRRRVSIPGLLASGLRLSPGLQLWLTEASGDRDSPLQLLQTFYETTLTALMEAKNDRLWFKTNLKLGKLWFDREEYGRLQRILKELHKSCLGEDGAEDVRICMCMRNMYVCMCMLCICIQKELHKSCLGEDGAEDVSK